MKHQITAVLFIAFLVSACSAPKKNYPEGFVQVWQNEELNVNASSLVVNQGHIYGTTLNETIFKADFTTGAIVWEKESSTSYFGQKPLVTNKQVFIGGSDAVRSFDLDGNLLWTHTTGAKIGHTLIEYDSLIFGSLTNKGLIAFNKKDGKIKWENLPDYQMLSSSRPSIQDSLIAIGAFDYSLDESSRSTQVINANTGKMLWSQRNNGYFTSEALFNQGRLYVCFDSSYVEGNVTAFNLWDGSILWKSTSTPETHIKPILLNKSLFVASYSTGLNCYDSNTGDLKWTLAQEELTPGTELIAFNDLVYFGTQKREFIAVDAEGKIQSRSKFSYGIGTPIVYKNCIYVVDGNGSLYKMEGIHN